MPALIQLVGASSRRRLLDEGRRPGRRRRWAPRRSADGSSTGVQGDGGLGRRGRGGSATRAREVEVGEHVAVDHEERARRCRPSSGGEADGAGGVERLGLDGVVQRHAGAACRRGRRRRRRRAGSRATARPRRRRGGPGAPTTRSIIGRSHDRQHLLGRGQGERPEPGAEAADEDDGPHGAAVAVVVGRRGGGRRRRRSAGGGRRRSVAGRRGLGAVAGGDGGPALGVDGARVGPRSTPSSSVAQVVELGDGRAAAGPRCPRAATAMVNGRRSVVEADVAEVVGDDLGLGVVGVVRRHLQRPRPGRACRRCSRRRPRSSSPSAR